MRSTKIICTIGPVTSSTAKLGKLIDAGMNVARLNFSHGDFGFFRKVITSLKTLRKKKGKSVAIMQDLQGPKIRIGHLPSPVTVKKGDEVCITAGKCKVGAGGKAISIDLKNLYKYVKQGNRILINDGLVALRVKKVNVPKKDILCTVTAGGIIEKRKGVNLPGIKIPVPSMTEKDKKDLAFGLKSGIDIVCLSFVREAKDITALKAFIKKRRKKNPPLVIAKIEKPGGVRNIKKIIDESDGIMIARGDLSVEIGYSRVPRVQKDFIKKANAKGKIVIVATQMLESMIERAYPQRAEVTDIYNAVSDGADTLMLSGETSTGKYPLKTVKVMRDVIARAEKDRSDKSRLPEFITTDYVYETVISYAGAAAASVLHKSEVAVCTHDIDDISYISDYRVKNGVISFTGDESLYYKLAIYSGINPVFTREKNEEKRVALIKGKFRNTENIIYIDFHSHGREKGRMAVYKVR